MKIKAVTLVELLVVVVIMALLAVIGVATLNGYQERAEIAALQANLRSSINELLVLRIDYESNTLSASDLMIRDLAVVEQAINLGRRQTNQNLIDITGNSCSDCVCRGDSLAPPLSSDAQTCTDRWDTILTALKNASDMDLTFMDTDPWGSPYLVDENEGENGGDYCRRDSLFSAGPDRLHETVGEDAAGDGYSIRLDFYDTAQCGT